MTKNKLLAIFHQDIHPMWHFTKVSGLSEAAPVLLLDFASLQHPCKLEIYLLWVGSRIDGYIFITGHSWGSRKLIRHLNSWALKTHQLLRRRGEEKKRKKKKEKKLARQTIRAGDRSPWAYLRLHIGPTSNSQEWKGVVAETSWDRSGAIHSSEAMACWNMRQGHGWLYPTAVLCVYGFLSMMRPAEPFLVSFLMGPQKNFTVQQVQYSFLKQ